MGKQNNSGRGSRGKRPGGRKPRIEALETRDLLSAGVPGFAVPDYVVYRGPDGLGPLSTAGPTAYTPAEIRSAYGFDEVAWDGSGATIAIVDAHNDPKIANDLHQFDLAFGLPDPKLTVVNQTGGTTLPAANSSWAGEIALDVEWAHAVAPGANILLVEAKTTSLSDLLKATDYARNASGVVDVSMSWGNAEFSGEAAYDSYFTTPAGHGGVTFLAASGDAGAPPGYPATSPNVISVGGTTLKLSLNPNGTAGYVSESGWSGSGGGISSFESQPAYQKGVVTQSTSFRTNPDVSFDADPNTGFSVYDSYNNPASAPWSQYGGTSAATPQWAALVAIADQGRAQAGLGTLDGRTQTLPAVYSFRNNDFRDIASGTSTGKPSYSAGTGYDLVTGLGSPNADLLINDLAVSKKVEVQAPTLVAGSNNLVLAYVQGSIRLVDFTNRQVLLDEPASWASSLTVQGGNTLTYGFASGHGAWIADTLTIDSSIAKNPGLLAGGVTFNCGAGLQGGTLVLRGAPGANKFALASDLATVNGLVVGFSGVQQLIFAGGTGNDTYQISDLPVNTTISDSGGANTLDFSSASSGVTLDLGKRSPQNIFAGSSNTLTLNGTMSVVLGGGGDNVLYAGPGNCVLVGGDGNDRLIGGRGRSMLIGGLGQNTLKAGTAGDLLIAGTTDYDQSPADLLAILAEWTSRRPVAARIKDLTRGIGPGGRIHLKKGDSVLDNHAADTLYGGPGADWFLSFDSDRIIRYRGRRRR